MNINDKEKTNRSNQHDDTKSTTEATSQKMREAMSENEPAWDNQRDIHKHHGDKMRSETSDNDERQPEPISNNEEGQSREMIEDDANAEYMDHQDVNETNDDDFDQPQPMSEGLSSIYAGRASTQEEREALARKRQQETNDPSSNRKKGPREQDKFKEIKDPMAWKNNKKEGGQYVDTKRGNYERHPDYQDRQGREKGANLENEYPSEERNRYYNKPDRLDGREPERVSGEPHPYGDTPSWKHKEYREDVRQGKLGKARGEVPSGHRDPNFSPARQNDWDNEPRGDEPYGDFDYEDREVRRRQDEGLRPWETTSDFESDYDKGNSNEDRRKYAKRRRQKEDTELDRHPSYQHRNSPKKSTRITTHNEGRHQHRRRDTDGRNDNE